MAIVNERYRFTNTGNSVMRIVGVSGVALAGLFVIGAVTAYGQINTPSQYGGTTAASSTTREICRAFRLSDRLSDAGQLGSG